MYLILNLVLNAKIVELEKDLFHPRMTYLKSIELEMKNKLTDFLVSEEKMEVILSKQTGFICPRDLEILKCPTTLSGCGHTFCKECVDTMREENFNVLKCDVCHRIAEFSYRNEQLERIKEQFNQRKQMTQVFSKW